MPTAPAPYLTRAELHQLGIAESALSKVSSDDIEVAVDAASRLADSYLVKRFTLPLTAWGADLKQHVANLAAYSLMKTRGFSPQRADADQLRDGHNDATKWLLHVAEGKATPIGVVDSDPAGSNNTDAGGEGRRRAFVVQALTETVVEEDFWGNVRGGMSDGSPRKRGW